MSVVIGNNDKMSLVKCVAVIVCVTCTTLSTSNARQNYENENRARLLSFLSVVSGYSTIEYLENGRLIPASMAAIPVETSAFGASLAYFYEETVDAALNLRHVMVLYEGEDGNIRVTPYNFTGWRDAPIGEQDLSVFQRKDISEYSTMDQCELVITEVEFGVYMGNWPECEDINELIPTFATVWTCNSTGFINYKNPEYNTDTNVPLVMVKTHRFPLLPSMNEGIEDFTDPCAQYID